MNFIEILVVLISGGAVGALGTWATATRDLALRRRMETTDVFMRVSARAHGYRENHTSSTVGTGEQMAAMFLVADLANRDKWLRKAAVQLLDEECYWLEAGFPDQTCGRLLVAAKEARSLIK
ncbi:hypothetical protein JOE65_000480 [Arthrobacter roseus]|nr:hypothetical protein [Arthrobacter roseus]